MSTADLRSFDEIEALVALLAAFSSATREAISEVDGAARAEIAMIDQRKCDLAWEAARLSDSCNSLDEAEDGVYLQDRLYEVEAELGHVEAAGARIEEAHAVFRSCANVLSHVTDDRLPAARNFLERKLEQARAYVSLHPPSNSDFSGRLASPNIPQAENGGAGPALRSFPLPAGFTWIPLEQVETSGLVPADFRKVSEGEIEYGFELLVQEILPRIQEGVAVDAAVFWEVDRAAGRDDAAGARRAFEAFFGMDAIRLDRRTGDAVYSIINGRHRVDVARRLGLSHVPARAVEVDR